MAAKKPPAKEATVRAAAKTLGLELQKQGKGWRLVNAETGTLVADDWAGDDGLNLEQIEAALKG